jgi:hypothetical protein
VGAWLPKQTSILQKVAYLENRSQVVELNVQTDLLEERAGDLVYLANGPHGLDYCIHVCNINRGQGASHVLGDVNITGRGRV